MPSQNIKDAILDALQTLENMKFHEFRDSLVNPEDTPCIRTYEVEKNTRREITNLLISRCEESGAVDRTLKTLRGIGCFNEARILESKCKPTSKTAKRPPSKPEPGPSSKPLCNQDNKESKDPQSAKKRKPKATKLPTSGNKIIPFGRHKGKSFAWVRQNDVGWATFVVATHLMERENGDQSQSDHMKIKDALAEYMSHFPDVEEKVHFYKEGLAPIGFGKYQNKTRKDLYDSKDEDEKSYVNWLRSKEDTCKGAPMEAMIEYILHCDRKAPVFTSYRTVPPRRASMKRDAPPSSQPAAKKQWI